MPEEAGITIHIPAPSEGVETVLILFGIGFLLFLVLAAFKAWPKRRKLIKRLPKFHEKISLNLLAVFALLMAVVWAALLVFTILGVFQLWLNPPAQDNGQNALAYRVHFLAIVGLMTALAGLVGAPLALIRVFTNERQTKATEEGLITDRINKAVEGLGAEKVVKAREFVALYKKKDGKRETDADGNPIPLLRGDGTPQGRWETSEETKPNLEVRIGAIYALERIAEDSKRDRKTICLILAAYIRENCDNTLSTAAVDRRLNRVRPDIDAAINACLHWPADTLLLSHKYHDLRGVTFPAGILFNAQFTLVDLNYCDLDATKFLTCGFDRCNFRSASMKTFFVSCELTNCKFIETEFSVKTNFETSNLVGSCFRKTDLKNKLVNQEQLHSTFGDASVSLPDELEPPEHWPKFVMGEDEFLDQWRKWQADPENYKPPEPKNA